ncbi:MAG: c-type cytochrome [Pseudomonadota bacterium]
MPLHRAIHIGGAGAALRRVGQAAALGALIVWAWIVCAGGALAQDAETPPDLTYVVVDGRSAPEPLSDAPPNAERGEALFFDAEAGDCASCHAAPGAPRQPTEPGPALGGVGARLSASAIRLWIINPRVLVEGSAMPAYYSLSPTDATPGAPADAPPRAEPRLDAASIEDLVAYLETLK